MNSAVWLLRDWGKEETITSQRWEDKLGLYDYNARYYDPTTARFLSADTIVPDPANPQSFNRYSYVLNSPPNFNDPTGHSCANPSGTSSDPNAPPEVVSCSEHAREILRATVRMTTRYRIFNLRTNQVSFDYGIHHVTMINEGQAITHNHFGENVVLNPGEVYGGVGRLAQLTAIEGGYSMPQLPMDLQEIPTAPETQIADFGGYTHFAVQAGLLGIIPPMAFENAAELVGQEVAQVVYDGEQTTVEWKTIMGVMEEDGQIYALVSASGGQGQSGGGVFFCRWVKHISHR